ncbi:hypothetical protein J132_00541 [Termitomyces sp. J132]|nr:hypothetical protein J132_00541 [Termitomyces sp. J132]
MPPCNNTTAPKWDESRPRELPQHFKELEYLFADCGITDNTQKKEYASQYVSYDTAETWLGLPEFGDNISNNAPRLYTYQEWKLAVLRLYPGMDASACYNLGDLERLVNQTFNSGLATLGRFSDYYRDFQRIARWLLANGKLYCNEEHCLFQQGIPTLLLSKIVHRLEITLPSHHPEDPYDVDQVFKGAKWVLKGMDTSTSNGNSGIPSSLPITNAPAAPSPMPKQETLELTTTTAIVSTLECLEALLTNDSKQVAMQQSLIHEVMQQDVTMGRALSKEEWIEALERELFALRRPGKKIDGVDEPQFLLSTIFGILLALWT